MNGSIIRYILGKVMQMEGALLLLPVFVSMYYNEPEGTSYMIAAGCTVVLGTLLSVKPPSDTVFYLKEGCIATALSWMLLSFFGAFPFILTEEIPNFTDAVFESASGFTTTGASILSDVEMLSHTSLFWRSFTHWIGGMGVLVFLLAVIPLTGGSNINLMRAESTGPAVGKLVPRIKTTARILYIIYFGLSFIEFILLVICRMPVFDAITLTFGTAGTGGFGVLNSSIASYSVACQWIFIIFMFLFGVNFNAFYFILLRRVKEAFAMEEVRTYFTIAFTATVVIAINIYRSCSGVFDAVTKSAFQVVSVMTTTGYSTVDFDLWPTFSKTVLVLLMFIGACAGSTGGGIKVSRILILFKTGLKELASFLYPRSVRKVNMDHKPVDHDVIRSTNVYMVTFILMFVSSMLLVSLSGYDLITTFTAVAATINNIGPGFAEVGPTQNFSIFNGPTTWVLIFDMLLGRLEMFPLLILFHPELWKEVIDQRKKKIYTDFKKKHIP